MDEKYYVRCKDCKFCKPEMPDWHTPFGTCVLSPVWLEVEVEKHGCYSGQRDHYRLRGGRLIREEGCGCG